MLMLNPRSSPTVLPFPTLLPLPTPFAATYGGLVHSSLVGVCTNYLGAQVP